MNSGAKKRGRPKKIRLSPDEHADKDAKEYALQYGEEFSSEYSKAYCAKYDEFHAKNLRKRHGDFVGAVFDLDITSEKIARELGVTRSTTTDQLANAGGAFLSLSDLYQTGNLIRKRQGNRPHIHFQQLLVDCARIHENATGEDGKAELESIGPRTEKQSRIVKYARATILVVTGKPHHQSMQQQCHQAAKVL